LTRKWVHKYEYGNEVEKEEQRRQLRSHKSVAKMLELWRKTAVITKRIAGSKSDSTNLNYSEYITVSRKMYKALYAEWDEVDANEAAHEDWERDSARCTTEAGSSERTLSGELFMDAMFELADTWTFGSNPDNYAGFLSDLFHHIAEGEPPDHYFWKKDEDIAYGGFELGAWEPTEKHLEERRARAKSREMTINRVSLPPLPRVEATPATASVNHRPITPPIKSKPAACIPPPPDARPQRHPGFSAWMRMVSGGCSNQRQKGTSRSTMPRLSAAACGTGGSVAPIDQQSRRLTGLEPFNEPPETQRWPPPVVAGGRTSPLIEAVSDGSTESSSPTDQPQQNKAPAVSPKGRAATPRATQRSATPLDVRHLPPGDLGERVALPRPATSVMPLGCQCAPEDGSLHPMPSQQQPLPLSNCASSSTAVWRPATPRAALVVGTGKGQQQSGTVGTQWGSAKSERSAVPSRGRLPAARASKFSRDRAKIEAQIHRELCWEAELGGSPGCVIRYSATSMPEYRTYCVNYPLS